MLVIGRLTKENDNFLWSDIGLVELTYYEKKCLLLVTEYAAKDPAKGLKTCIHRIGELFSIFINPYNIVHIEI